MAGDLWCVLAEDGETIVGPFESWDECEVWILEDATENGAQVEDYEIKPFLHV